MKTALKILVGIVIAFAVLVSALVLEAKVRNRQGGEMDIVGLPITNAQVTSTWHPDFLWAGKAWVIEIESVDDLELTLDDRVYVVPKGSHRIYSNHDSTNTGEFGNDAFWGYPEYIEITSIENLP